MTAAREEGNKHTAGDPPNRCCGLIAATKIKLVSGENGPTI